ncbi:Mor transcription activator family protein [Desulfotruncus arcticus]|uniref:Mor transcription activator family protein n=1 Tax=Desulfotruncus arcticus TaxID=341036 RepID=UPI001EE407EF|nr:Mor transcription activator family protein [Desulfotruncus arcticus]
MLESWINDLTLDMIPDSYRELAEIIGIENFIKLAKILGGKTIYIPKADTFLRPARDINIKKEFNGYNHAELAKKYNLSERWIVEICGPANDGQLTLLDFGFGLDEQDAS